MHYMPVPIQTSTPLRGQYTASEQLVGWLNSAGNPLNLLQQHTTGHGFEMRSSAITYGYNILVSIYFCSVVVVPLVVYYLYSPAYYQSVCICNICLQWTAHSWHFFPVCSSLVSSSEEPAHGNVPRISSFFSPERERDSERGSLVTSW